MVRNDNEISKQTVENANFKIDNELLKELNLTGYKLYSKENQYFYKNERLRK